MDFNRWLRAEWDRVAGYSCLALGVVLLVAGFWGVRHAADVIDEISYLVTGGIGAMFLLGVGATLLLSADLHDDFRKLHRVEEKLDRIEHLLLAEHPELIDLSGDGPGGEPAGNGQPRRAGVEAPSAPFDDGVAVVRRSRLLAVAGVVVAAALYVAGWVRTANEASTDRMTGGVGVALAGALLAALVAGLLVTQLRGSHKARKLAVLGPWMADGSTVAAGAPATGAAERVVVVGGLGLYHRLGCKALEGRPATEIDRAALAEVRPCGLCEPD